MRRAVRATLYCVVFATSLLGAAGLRGLRFAHLTTEQGLSHNTVTSMVRDPDGYLWIGTVDGLNRYDGYACRIWRHNPADARSLPSSFIHMLCFDKADNMWIATRDGGLAVMSPEDRRLGRFRSFSHDPARADTLSDTWIQTLFCDSAGRLWIGTRQGLDLYEAGSDGFRRFSLYAAGGDRTVTGILQDPQGLLWVSSHAGLFQVDPERLAALPDGAPVPFVQAFSPEHDDTLLPVSMISSVFQDSRGNLWLGFRGNGMGCFNPHTLSLRHYERLADGPRGMLDDNARVAAEDDDGVLWIAGRGLTLYDPETGASHFYRHQPDNAGSLSIDNITQVYRSDDGTRGSLWVLTWGGGVNRVLENRKPFALVRHDPTSEDSPSGNFIFSMAEDRFGMAWVGTIGTGLNRWDRARDHWTRYTHDTDPDGISDDNIWMITRDRDDQLWICTEWGGLNRVVQPIPSAPVRFHRIRHDPERPDSLASDNVKVFFHDSYDTYWAGTNGYGLSAQTAAQRPHDAWRRIKAAPEQDGGLSSNNLICMVQGTAGELWAGTNDAGLNRLDPADREAGRFRVYRADPSRADALKSDDVRTLLMARDGRLWVGTYGGGLSLYLPEQDGFRTWTTAQGLPNDFIYGLLEDDQGHVWMSSNRGLADFNPETETVTAYTMVDGLQADEFNTGACMAYSSGELFFGGVNGFNYFLPSALRAGRAAAADHAPAVVLTDLEVLGRSRPLPHPAAGDPAEVRLHHDDRFFAFQWSALVFENPTKNRYAYMLEPFDDAWIDNEHRRHASYTNLDPGTYRLRLKGAGPDGPWGEAAPLRIVVIPPFYRTWWFRALVLLALVVSVPVGMRIREYYHTWRGVKFVAHYKLLRLLGKGGSGTVYLAQDRLTRRRIALKVLHGHVEQAREGLRRFVQEAEIGGRLNHPNVVAVYEAGSSGKTRYIAMEYLEGDTLREHLDRHGAMPLPELSATAEEIVAGMQAIHDHDIVHRDLKAANVMLCKTGEVKIMDFGLARLSTLSTVENLQQLMGTLAYMSPEQTIGKRVDARSDVYSMGVLLYEMYLGRLPFLAENQMELIYAIHNEPVTGLSGASPALEAIIMRCMEKEPAARYPDMAALRTDLKALAPVPACGTMAP